MQIVAPHELRSVADLAFLAGANRARAQLTIDLSQVTWISPLGVVSILATSMRARDIALGCTVLLPEDRHARLYLGAIGLNRELEAQGWRGDAAGSGPGPGSVRACLPVTPLRTERDIEIAANGLWEAFESARLPGNLFPDAIDLFIELSGNAREHGSPCYAVAQTHSGATSGTPGIHLAVGDFGAGFAASLRAHHGPMNDVRAMSKAFEEGISGTGQAERGFGLGFILDYVDRYDGSSLELVSQRGYMTRRERQSEWWAGPRIAGTFGAAYFPYTGVGE